MNALAIPPATRGNFVALATPVHDEEFDFAMSETSDENVSNGEKRAESQLDENTSQKDVQDVRAEGSPGNNTQQPELTPAQAETSQPQPKTPEAAASTDDSELGDTLPAMRATKPARQESRPALPRGQVRSIHYTLSYAVANATAGPRGAIVLLHDLPGGAFVWEPAMARLAETGRAVYAFDMLGYGQSDHPWPSDTSIWGHADVLTYAFQALKLHDSVLVGFGVGGGVAQVLATRLYRDGVAKLALVNSYGYQYTMAPNWPLPDMAGHQDPEAAHHAKVDEMLEALRTTLPTGSAKPDALSKQRIAAYADEWNGDVGKQMLYQHVRLLRADYMNAVSSDMRRLEIPLLLVWSEKDEVTPLATIGQRLQAEIPGAQLQVIPAAGHLVLDDAPDAVAQRIAEFAGPLK
jgi:pimeloyl-ACP methyl ester carboxylesterase